MNYTIKVNDKPIVLVTIQNEKYVSIRSVCDAIGVDYSRQLKKIKEDEILNSVISFTVANGTDGKEYKMRVIPLRYVFGWLFTINPNNVKPEIKQSVIDYRMECYNALFDTFTKRDTILKEKTNYQLEIEKLEEELHQDSRYIKIQELKGFVKEASTKLNALDKGVVNEQLQLFKKDAPEPPQNT